jgi:hypothetical protein
MAARSRWRLWAYLIAGLRRAGAGWGLCRGRRWWWRGCWELESFPPSLRFPPLREGNRAPLLEGNGGAFPAFARGRDQRSPPQRGDLKEEGRLIR